MKQKLNVSLASLALTLLLAACGAQQPPTEGAKAPEGNSPAAAAPVVAAPASNPPPAGLWGSWVAPRITRDDGKTEDYTIHLSPGVFAATLVCAHNGKQLTAEISTAAKYSDKQISVTERARKSESADGIECNASLDKAVVDYVVNGNALTLRANGEKEIVLNRKK